MTQKLVLLFISVFVIVGLTSCSTEDTSEIQILKQEMVVKKDQNIIIVQGTAKNATSSPKIGYIYCSVYGDFGMVKDNRKKLLKGGDVMKPGETVEFSMEFKYNAEIKTAKARGEGKEPNMDGAK
jgi:hypothetical protein